MNTILLCAALLSLFAFSQCTPTHVSSHQSYGASSSSYSNSGGGGGSGSASEGFNFGGGEGQNELLHHKQHHEHHHEEYHEPKPYAFGYSVKDFKKGTSFNRREMNDGHNVKGEYEVALPDGRLQVVKYNADWKNGFHADVKYEGEAHHPEIYTMHEDAGLEHKHSY